jgi:zinc transport system substrate-binding protein
MIVMTPRSLGTVLSVLAIAMVSACGSSEGAGVSSSGKVAVSAAFYPLQFAVEQVGGSHVSVASVTKPGAEPHDLELTPKDVAGLQKSDLVVYEKGFQPALDDALKQDGDKALDVSSSAELDLAAPAEEHDHEASAPAEPAGHNAKDPHFWLDPVRYAAVATAIGERLAAVDPAHAADYRSGAAAFDAKLDALNNEYTSTLSTCKQKEIVTGHAAFGYLARRYGLSQEGIAGVTPDAEPDAATMKEIVEHIKEHRVTTVYAETLVSPALAETIGRETGAKVEVLDPVEGITGDSRGKDYFEVMRSNLNTLKSGQGCS